MNIPMTTIPTSMIRPMHPVSDNQKIQFAPVTAAPNKVMPITTPNACAQCLTPNTLRQLFPSGKAFMPELDLPELLFVETRFISLSKAVQASFAAQTNNNIEPIILSAGEVVAAKPTTSNVETFTDNPNPTRDRSQQTETMPMNTQTVAIQCNLETDDFDYYDFDHKSTNNINEKETAMDFQQFATAHSWQHSNGHCECLICGEITVDTKTIAHHLAYHFGPPALCSTCGRNFEHEHELEKHRCVTRRKAKQKRAINALHCPYYRCNVTAISLLELYDHINEHSAQCSYHCSKCKRNFPTACELFQHIRFRRSCRDAHKHVPYPRRLFNSKNDTAYRVRVRRVYTLRRRRVYFKSFLSFAMRSRHMRHGKCMWRCQLCMKRSTNEFMHARHFLRCFQDYQYRLQRTREKL